MLNYFPQLLDFGILAPLVWRVALALNYFWLGSRPAANRQIFLAFVLWLGGFALLVGAATQVVAPVLAITLLATRKSLAVPHLILLLFGTLALLFSGAGWLALDQPL